MSAQVCGLCGRDPAAGFATINDVRYCHGDDDPEPTCYMRSQAKYVPFSPSDQIHDQTAPKT